MRPVTVLAGVIMNKDNVLITRRAPKETRSGGWEFPGGKLEANETHNDCLVRELSEELAVVVNVGNFCVEISNDYGDIEIELLAYYCTIREGDISLSVHDKFKWVKVCDLLSCDLLPADIGVARKIVEDFQ